MKKLADEEFDFDEDSFTDEELADLESLSDEEFDLDLDDDFDNDEIDIDALKENWKPVEKASSLEERVDEELAIQENKLDQEQEPSSVDTETVATAEEAVDTTTTAELPPVVEPPAVSPELDRSAQEKAALDELARAFAEPEEKEQNEPAMVEAPAATPEPALPEEEADPELTPDVAIDMMPNEASVEEAPLVAEPLAAQVVDDELFDDEEVGAHDHIPVPRINIGIFCETEAISDLAEASAADRRLSKAHVSIFMGGVRKAAQHYQSQSTPNLLVIEVSSAGKELFDGLAKLADVCDPTTKVIIVGAINDIRLYRELMNRGISEYLIAPKSPIQLTRSIASLYIDPSAPPLGRSMVFVGARGGVGSSTICHNVAWAMAERHQSDTVILDLDLAFGTASLDFEQDPSQGLAEALASPERLDDVLLERLLQKCTDRLSLFAAPNVLEHDYDMPASAFEEVVDMVRKGVPNLVVDLPHAWTGWTRHVLQTADDIVLTATPDLSSFRNAKNMLESIKAARANDAPPILVLNQTGVPKRPEIPADQFAEALEIEPSAVIQWDPQLFGLATTNAETVFETNARSKVASGMDHIANLLLGNIEKKSSGSLFSLKSLFGKK